MVTKSESANNRINCSTSSPSLAVPRAPHSEPRMDETTSDLSMAAQLLASEWNVAGQGTGQGKATASITGNSLKRERGAPSTDLTRRGPGMGSNQSKCGRLLNYLRYQEMTKLRPCSCPFHLIPCRCRRRKRIHPSLSYLHLPDPVQTPQDTHLVNLLSIPVHMVRQNSNSCKPVYRRLKEQWLR